MTTDTPTMEDTKDTTATRVTQTEEVIEETQDQATATVLAAELDLEVITTAVEEVRLGVNLTAVVGDHATTTRNTQTANPTWPRVAVFTAEVLPILTTTTVLVEASTATPSATRLPTGVKAPTTVVTMDLRIHQSHSRLISNPRAVTPMLSG